MTDRIAVTGNIATNPEHRRTSAGLTITSFRLATSRRRHDRDRDEWIDSPPNYYSVSAFRDLGENAFVALKKGQRVIVTGTMKIREWETDTKKGISVEIDADSLGHDLRWGTTTFHPAGDAEAARHASSHEAGGPDAGTGGERWSAPGVTERTVAVAGTDSSHRAGSTETVDQAVHTPF